MTIAKKKKKEKPARKTPDRRPSTERLIDVLHGSLPDAVRLNVVIGTLDTTIPSSWLEDEEDRKIAVKEKMLAKVEVEIDKVWDVAVKQWEEMKRRKR